jgi:hypothetical protein
MNIKNIKWVLVILLLTGAVSCKKYNYAGYTAGTGKPTITLIHTLGKTDTGALNIPVNTIDTNGNETTQTFQISGISIPFDSVTTSANGGSYIVIVGHNLGATTTVTFNDTAAFINRAWNTDTTIIVAVPSTAWTPTEPNTLTVTTLYGSVTTTFHINQPAPNITGLNPSAGSAGDTIAINGSVFYNVDSVTFTSGTITDVQAKIVSYTPTQILVVVPPGIVEAFVNVYSAGGVATSPSAFGFKYIIFKDGLTTGWGGNGGGYSGYNSTINFTDNSNPPPGGTEDIMTTIGGGYGALQIGFGGPTITVSTLNLLSVRFAIAGGSNIPPGGQPAQVVINGNYTNNYQFTILASSGGYQTIIVPLSALGNPATISEFVIQMQGGGGAGAIFYVDNLGFI